MAKEIGAKAQIPNPALQRLEPLVGEWQTTGTHPYLPDTTLQGRAVFAWIEGGAFLMMRSQIDHPKFPDGTAIFGSDDEAGTYFQVNFDERGISRVYNVSVTENRLAWWREDAHLLQRFAMAITEDRLVTTGEMSHDGGEWEKDLALIYKKF